MHSGTAQVPAKCCFCPDNDILCFPQKNHNTVNIAALSNSEKWLYCWFLTKLEVFFCKFGLSFTTVPFFSFLPKSWKWSVIFSNALMLYELLQHSKNTWLGPAPVSPACCFTSKRSLGVLHGSINRLCHGREQEGLRGISGFRATSDPATLEGTPCSLSECWFRIQNCICKSSEYECQRRKKHNYFCSPYLNLETVWPESIGGILTEILISFTWDHSRY